MPPRKRGSRRIDAALDAMRPYGFSGHVVQETVKELLDVYGGDAGWIFVEEASYTLLIETILEKQKDAVPKVGQEINEEALHIEDPSHLNNVSDEEALPIEGPSHWNEVSSATEAINIPQLTHKVSDSPSQTTDHGRHVEARQSRILAAHSTPRFQRRKPYYGWISGDSEGKPYFGWISGDSEEEDLVDLLPAHTNEELSMLLHLSSKPKRHKT